MFWLDQAPDHLMVHHHSEKRFGEVLCPHCDPAFDQSPNFSSVDNSC